ncbi:MAG: hypothetical protein M3067_09475 [Chloroflexota bacterium]|nr:hypothetical protein [Chloroflexota bacterium]
MSRSLAALLAAGLLLVGSLAFAGGATAATAIAPTTTCSNGVDNTAGLGLICETTIVNRITSTGGSARVTVRECHGSSGVPATACTTVTSHVGRAVTNVNQCNDAGNGGGGNLRCTVRVTNNFVGLATGATPVSVNQCVGSGGGGGGGITCDPTPAAVTGATITQCNGSANGGGVVPGSTCTATGTNPSSHNVKINQCNGSVNGGGSKIVCSASITNVRVAVATPAPSASGGSGGGSTPPPTDTIATTTQTGSGQTQVIFIAAFLFGFALFASRRSLRGIHIR